MVSKYTTRIDRKCFDCFTFYNELELLEVRLHELRNVVDYHVIVEANLTHLGDPKPLYFKDNKHRFIEFLPKIIHKVVEFPDHDLVDPASKDMDYYSGPAWGREWHQRNFILKAAEFADDDIVFISDVDEIPKADVFKQLLLLDSIKVIELTEHIFYMNWWTKVSWLKAYGGPAKLLRDIDTSQLRRIHPNLFAENPHFVIRHGGWHFSSMGGLERAAIKANACVEGGRKSIEDIQTQMQACHAGDGGRQLYILPMNMLPEYVQEREQHYREIGFLA